MKTFLAVDGGGTKTLCLVADERGKILGYGTGGGANANLVPHDVARQSVQDAIQGAWAVAGKPPTPPCAVISGPTISYTADVIVETTGTKAISRASESEVSWNSVRPWLERDYDLPLDVAVTIDAGTGSTAGGFNRAGQRASVGGWGWLLGDEGSGFWIGLKAIQAAIMAEDGRGPATDLHDAIVAEFGLDTLHALIPPVYQGNLGRCGIAKLSRLVSDVARQGDDQARAILAAAGRELARMVDVVIRRLDIEDEAFAVVPFGSVFKAGEAILDPFRRDVLKTAPDAQVVLPRYESVVGTLLLAMQRGGIPTAEVWPALEGALNDVERVLVRIGQST